MIGKKNDACTPIESAKKPCKTGTNAPPTIAIHKIPDPCDVCLPKPITAKLKIVGNIIELASPISNTAHIATAPLVVIAISNKITALTALKAKTLPAAIFCITAAPMNRPTMAPPK